MWFLEAYLVTVGVFVGILQKQLSKGKEAVTVAKTEREREGWRTEKFHCLPYVTMLFLMLLMAIP